MCLNTYKVIKTNITKTHPNPSLNHYLELKLLPYLHEAQNRRESHLQAQKTALLLNKTCDETLMKQTENQKSLYIYIYKKIWAEMVMGRNGMGRNGYGPKWSWAEMVMGRNDPEPFSRLSILVYI